MSTEAAAHAAEALIAYRRGSGPEQLHARDLCRRLEEALDGGGAAGPHTATSTAFLTLALDLAARRDAEVRRLTEALAQAVGGHASEPAPAVQQTVTISGNGHNVNVAGRDLHVRGAPASRDSSSTGPRRDAQPEVQPITILFVTASPDDQAKPQVDREVNAVREAIRPAVNNGSLRLEVWPAVRPLNFINALLDLRPQVVHFSGHGAHESGELLFEDEFGSTIPAHPDALRGIFSRMKSTVQCVVLNACYGHANAGAILESIPYVIAMEGDLDDEAAITFSTGFYTGLAAGETVPDAYGWGCDLLRMTGPEHALPRLEVRRNAPRPE